MTTKTPSLTRRQRKRQATIQTILDTSRAIMREEGVAALSLHEIARRMGMRAPSLYNYFGSKSEIYDALFRFGFEQYASVVVRAEQEGTGFHDEIRRIIEGYLHFALTNPELYQLCFERPVPGFIPSAESLAVSFGLLHSSYDRIAHYRPQLDTTLTNEEIANLIIAIAHGLTAMHLSNEPQLPAGEGRFGSLIPTVLAMLHQAIPLKGDT